MSSLGMSVSQAMNGGGGVIPVLPYTMSPFEDQNGLQHVAEIKEEQKTQSLLGDILTIIILLQHAC